MVEYYYEARSHDEKFNELLEERHYGLGYLAPAPLLGDHAVPGNYSVYDVVRQLYDEHRYQYKERVVSYGEYLVAYLLPQPVHSREHAPERYEVEQGLLHRLQYHVVQLGRGLLGQLLDDPVQDPYRALARGDEYGYDAYRIDNLGHQCRHLLAHFPPFPNTRLNM